MDGRFRIGKVYISESNPTKAKDYIINKCMNGDGGYICVSNIRMIRYADKHPEYAALMNNSLVNLPDGTPLTWCAKLWGVKGIKCTNGPALFKTMIQTHNEGIMHFLLGDTEDTLRKIVDCYQTDLRNIVGYYSPPFAEIDEFDYEGIAKMIGKSGANLVWTAMRAPKQDEFNVRMSKLLPHVVFVGVGRAFRASIGEFKEVPAWAQKMGLSGFWLRRGSFWAEMGFYLSALPSLLKYMSQIVWWRMIGRKCDE